MKRLVTRLVTDTVNQVPRNLRVIYVHAYQSYIWNLVTSERIKVSSTNALVGDLAYVEATPDVDLGTPASTSYHYQLNTLSCICDVLLIFV